jgi:hypothetical protein
MDKVIVKNGKKYSGQYVAMKSFSDRTVISHGHEAEPVLKAARERGFLHPVIFYVPKKGMTNVY